MFNLTLTVFFLLCAIQKATFEILENDENGLSVKPAVLPYSLKSGANKDNDGRYSMAGIEPTHNQVDEQQLTESSANILDKRRTDDPWNRISAHYKNQLALIKSPIDEFGYYNPHGVITQPLNDVNHFGSGSIIAPLPLVLMLIVNIGVLIYLVVGVTTTLSAAIGGFNYRLPYHTQFRRDDNDNKFN